jgi:lysophospholipase L1-like esterase
MLLYGPGAPLPSDGVDGDFWINTTAWSISGPKLSGLWPAAILLGQVPSLGVTSVSPHLGDPAGTPLGALPTDRIYQLVDDAGGRVVLDSQGRPALAAPLMVPQSFLFIVDAIPLAGGEVLRWAIKAIVSELPDAVFDAPLTLNRALPAGTLLANLSNPVTGETWSVLPADGRLQVNGNRLEIGPAASPIGKATFTVRRVFAAATNSPHDTAIEVIAGDVDYRLGVLAGASLVSENHTDSGSSTSNGALTSYARAQLVFGNALAGMPVGLPESYERTDRVDIAQAGRGANMGFGGKSIRSIEQVVSRVVSACKAGHAFVEFGRNGIPQVPLAEQFTRYTAMCDLMRSQGRVIWHLGLFMRASYVPGDTNWNFLVSLDQWQRQYALDNNETYVDFREAMHSGSSEYYGVNTAAMRDGIHLNALGGWLCGQKFRQVLEGVFGSKWPDISAIATDPLINKISNPYMTGTGGSKANGATGTVPDGYWLQGGAAGTVAVSGQTVVKDGVTQYEITITPPGVAGALQSLLFRCNPNKFGVAEKHFEFIAGRVEVGENAGALVRVNTRLQLAVQPLMTTTILNKNSSDLKNINLPFKARMGGAVIEYKASAGGTSTTVGMDIVVDPAGTSPFKIYTSEWILREVPQALNYPEIVRESDNRD